MKNILLLYICYFISSISLLADPPTPFPSIPSKRSDYKGYVYESQIGTEKVRLPFAIFLPKGYDADKNRKWPMIVFLHGGGEIGTDLQGCFVHGFHTEFDKSPAMVNNFPFIVLHPQSNIGQDPNKPGVYIGWEDKMAQAVVSLIKILPDHYRIDQDRISSTGLSMGGSGVWDVLNEDPNLWSAAVPICGRAFKAPETLAARLKYCPVWTIDGLADAPHFVGGARRMHKALSGAGCDSQLTLIPGVDHFAWLLHYNNPEFFQWLLRQTRPTAEMRGQAENLYKLKTKENTLFFKGKQATINVAAEENGGVATASSNYASTGYHANATINGDRLGISWASDPVVGSGWHSIDTTLPSWLQIDFKGTQPISEIDVFSVQDNYQAPIDPTPTMIFTLYGLTAFQVQYWTGTAWEDVPGGKIVDNNLVWRKITFPVINTAKIRVQVNATIDMYSRILEVEAWKPITAKDVKP